jgi:hypothetical protein
MLFDPRDATDASQARRRRYRAHLAPVLVALACAASLPVAYAAWWKADWRALARQVDENRRAGDVVVFIGDTGPSDPNANFLYTSFYRHQPYGPTVLMDRPPDEALARQLEPFQGTLIVTAGDEHLSRVFPGARFRRLAFEPGAASLWRAERSD